MYKDGNAWKPTVTEKGIYGFFGQYRWLSNFHMSPCSYEGLTYPSSEHAYQAAKTDDEHIRRLYLSLQSPGMAKRFGQHVPMRRDWDNVRVQVMGEVILSKFESDPFLRDMLMQTEHLYLEETNHWGDRFWGVCDGRGENNLGIVLMAVRSVLRVNTFY